MHSLITRVLVAAGLVLIVFLGLTVMALDLAFRSAGERAIHERLEIQALALISAAEVDATGVLHMPPELPEPRFSNPGSGLYARIVDRQGRQVWRSASAVGVSMGEPTSADPGTREFTRVTTDRGSEMFRFGLTVAWDLGDVGLDPVVFHFMVGETLEPYRAQLTRFRVNLFGWFGVLFAGLIIAQLFILRRTLHPLRELALEVAAIEAGREESVGGAYPRELQRLARNLNALIRNERAHLGRYRDTLTDLAHSIKTPLAVIKVALQEEPGERRDRTIADQVARINEIVGFQLQRAGKVGRTTFGRAIAVSPAVEELVTSLQKVYRDKDLVFERRVDAASRFRGDHGELLEILGNLLDNACKWARHTVRVGAAIDAQDLVLRVEDDGPGIPADRRGEVLARGIRADESVEGQGIGLAVVHDIVGRHGGRLELGESDLGGLSVTVRVPA